MERNYIEKQNDHAHGYGISISKSHPIVFSESLSMHIQSFEYVKRISKNIFALLTRVGVTIVKCNTIRANCYQERLQERREENTELLFDKMKDVAPKNPGLGSC